jgi:hypothetical protein
LLTQEPIRSYFRKGVNKKLGYLELFKSSVASSLVVTFSGAFFDHLNTYQKSNGKAVSTALKNVKIMQLGRGAAIQFAKIAAHNFPTLAILEYNELKCLI